MHQFDQAMREAGPNSLKLGHQRRGFKPRCVATRRKRYAGAGSGPRRYSRTFALLNLAPEDFANQIEREQVRIDQRQ